MITAVEVAATIAKLRDKAQQDHARCRSVASRCLEDCVRHPPWPSAALLERPGPSTAADWAGLARKAHARQHAGRPLTDRDLEAIRRIPADD